MAQITKLLDPNTISTVEGLELLARQIVEGYLTGANRSLKTGIGQEFSQYRSYQPGDDLRLLDWKMFARSDRYYIREAEIETSIIARFVVDASASMLHNDNGIAKMDYARLLTASLAYVAKKQGDALGLYALNDQQYYHLTPRQGNQHFYRFLYELLKINNQGRWPVSANTLHLKPSHNKELIIFISDMYEYNKEIISTLKHLSSGKNEVILFHLMGANEMNLSYKGVLSLEDMETGETIQVDSDSARAHYIENVRQHLNQLKKEMLEIDISYELITMDQPLDQALGNFLKRRMRLL